MIAYIFVLDESGSLRGCLVMVVTFAFNLEGQRLVVLEEEEGQNLVVVVVVADRLLS